MITVRATLSKAAPLLAVAGLLAIWQIALKVAAAMESDDVRVILIKDGDHRLSRPQDIALITETVESLIG